MHRYVLILTALFIVENTWAVRPFVTDDARIVDQGQLTAEFWVDESVGDRNFTPDLNFLAGTSPTQWLEVSTASGLGLHGRFGKDVTNPVFQSKILLFRTQVDGPPGLALSLGHVPNVGAGESKVDGSSTYLLALISRRLFDDELLIHLNLGGTRSWVEPHGTETMPFWGIGSEFSLWAFEWRGVVEAFSGDPFNPIRTDIAAQAGLRWLQSDLLNFDVIAGAEPELNPSGTRSGEIVTWVQFGIRITGDVYSKRKGRADGGDGLIRR